MIDDKPTAKCMSEPEIRRAFEEILHAAQSQGVHPRTGTTEYGALQASPVGITLSNSTATESNNGSQA